MPFGAAHAARVLNKRPRTDGADGNTQECKALLQEDVDELHVDRQESTGTECCRSRARAPSSEASGLKQ